MFTKVTLIAIQEESQKNAGLQTNIGSRVDQNEGSSVKKQKMDFTNLRKSNEKYEDTFPDFYFSNIEDGWYCKICSSFAQGIIGPTSFVNKAGDFGDHPNRTVSRHLSSTRHQNASKNKSAYDKLSKRHGNVWKMMQDASLASKVQKTQTNRFILKSFFRITWVLISKNWAHTHNFKTLAELVGTCGGKELQVHLLTSPKNATFMSPHFLQKYIQIMDEHLKLPLLASLKCGPSPFSVTKHRTQPPLSSWRFTQRLNTQEK